MHSSTQNSKRTAIRKLIEHIINDPGTEYSGTKEFSIGNHSAEYRITKMEEHKLWTPFRKQGYTRCFKMLNMNAGDFFVINHVLNNAEQWLRLMEHNALIIPQQTLAATLHTDDQFEDPIAIDLTGISSGRAFNNKVSEINSLIIAITDETVKRELHFNKRFKTRKKQGNLPKGTATRAVKKETKVKNTLFERHELIIALNSFDANPVVVAYKRKYLDGKSPAEILDFAFGSSIARAFHYESPKRRFRGWRWYEKANQLLKKMDAKKNQDEFDDFAYGVAESLVQDWGDKKNNGQPTYMNMGIALKITNLILKHSAYSDHSHNPDVKTWLHVPWDRYTLLPLQSIWAGNPPTPRDPGQGFVKKLDLYKELHSLITDIAGEAGIPRIIYEFWAWDRSH